MELPANQAIAPAAAYAIGAQLLSSVADGFAEAIASAYSNRQRPRCLCVTDGVEMYVARLGEGYIVKRMPDTGSYHATDCPSYEPPAESSGLGQVLGSAITEDPATGETTLKLDFPLSKMMGRSVMPAAGGDSDSVASSGTKLSLRGLLHYLWDQADLARWHPGFAGRRSWATVRNHLLQAAEPMFARGDALRTRLYVPEPFSMDQRDAINARRMARWQHVVAAPGRPQHLMLLIGEVKEIVPARYGFKAVIKHVPDQAFAIDEQLYRRLGRCFDTELALWSSADDVHMVVIATFGVSGAGIPLVAEMSLMPTTPQWLPIEDAFERQLVERLVAEGRAFIKGLRYNLDRGQSLAAATLTDSGDIGSRLYIVPPGSERVSSADLADRCCAPGVAPIWIWQPGQEPILPLPQPQRPSTDTRLPRSWCDAPSLDLTVARSWQAG